MMPAPLHEAPAQAVHAPAPAALYAPAGHAVHAVAYPVPENVPAAQVWQEVCSPSMKYFPGPQHTLADVPVQRGTSDPVQTVAMPHPLQLEAVEPLYVHAGQ
jgi:hypothetical protein